MTKNQVQLASAAVKDLVLQKPDGLPPLHRYIVDRGLRHLSIENDPVVAEAAQARSRCRVIAAHSSSGGG